MSEQSNLRSVKSAAKSTFGAVPGVEGFGLGENSLRIYIRNSSVRRQLPAQFQGIPIDFVVTGEVNTIPAPPGLVK